MGIDTTDRNGNFNQDLSFNRFAAALYLRLLTDVTRAVSTLSEKIHTTHADNVKTIQQFVKSNLKSVSDNFVGTRLLLDGEVLVASVTASIRRMLAFYGRILRWTGTKGALPLARSAVTMLEDILREEECKFEAVPGELSSDSDLPLMDELESSVGNLE